jgi:hypothetical protein
VRQAAIDGQFACDARLSHALKPADFNLPLGEHGEPAVYADFKLRSLYAVFQYLGALANAPQDQTVLWYAPPLRPDADRRLFPVFAKGGDCYVAGMHGAVRYCLPANAYEAKAALNVLTLLMQMDTNRVDLPSSAVSVQF